MKQIISIIIFSVIIFSYQNCVQPVQFDIADDLSSHNSKALVSLVGTEKLVPFDEAVGLLKTQNVNDETKVAGVHNFGFHTGHVDANLQPVVDEYLFGNVHSPSKWYFAQWKKNFPIKPSNGMEVIQSEINPLIRVKNKNNPGTSEAELTIHKDVNQKIIYQLETRQGFLNTAGGSNIFLSTSFDYSTIMSSSLDRDIYFQSKIKMLKKSAVLRSAYTGRNDILAGELSGALQAGFPVLFYDDSGQMKQRIFIQVLFADTRYNRESDLHEFRGYYQNGTLSDGSPMLEFTATIPINKLTKVDSDFKYSADHQSANPTDYNVSLTKLLCYVMKEQFVPIGAIANMRKSNGQYYGNENLQNFQNGMLYKNLKNWKLTGGYFGFESQAVRPEDSQFVDNYHLRTEFLNQIESAYKGDVELQAQFSDFDIKAGNSASITSCEHYDKVVLPLTPTPSPTLSFTPARTPSSTPTPKLVTPTPTVTPQDIGDIKGNFESVILNSNKIVIKGWACANKIESAIGLHIYSQGPSGSGIYITGGSANLSRELAVAQVCGTTSLLHGFVIELNEEQTKTISGKAIYIHGLSPDNSRPNNLLVGSGRIAPAVLTPTPTPKPVTPTPTVIMTPTPTPQPKLCAFGADINVATDQAFEWACNCEGQSSFKEKSGWVLQSNGCYHRSADNFCSSGTKVYYTCLSGVVPSNSRWMKQADGCYHFASTLKCN